MPKGRYNPLPWPPSILLPQPAYLLLPDFEEEKGRRSLTCSSHETKLSFFLLPCTLDEKRGRTHSIPCPGAPRQHREALLAWVSLFNFRSAFLSFAFSLFLFKRTYWIKVIAQGEKKDTGLWVSFNLLVQADLWYNCNCASYLVKCPARSSSGTVSPQSNL